MRAVQYHEYGGPQVLVVEAADDPHADPGQLRIRVRAASVNPVDWKFRAGYMAQVTPVEFPVIPGRDAAGVVDEVGSGVSDVRVGDEVFGLAVGGATAELAVLSAWAAKPAVWSFAQAAAAGVAVATASRTLDELGVTAGSVVLIEGAAGGVGSAAIQLAVARGATVIGTASQGNHDILRGLGAEPTTYGPGLPERVRGLAPEGVDAVLDTAGSGSMPDLIAIAGSPQKVLTIADYGAAASGVKVSRGRGGRVFEGLAEAARLGNEGRFRMPVHAEFPMEQAGAAHELSATGHVPGKIVITIS